MAIIEDKLEEERTNWHDDINYKLPYKKALEYVKDKEVADLCCGLGQGVHIMAKVAKHVTGYDYSKTAIEECNKRVPWNANFILKDIEEDIRTNAEVITCMQGLEHLNDPKKLINKYRDRIWIIALPHEINPKLIKHHYHRISDELIKNWFGNIEIYHFNDWGEWDTDNFTNFFGVYNAS